MRFSIIIPVYNSEKTLGRCLDSILKQDYSDYEIILVNDGSSDASEKICIDYAYKYPNIKYRAKTNGGASSARNSGLDIAEGDYILFVDSDDYVDKDYFFHLKDNYLKNGLSIFTYTWKKTSGFVKRNISVSNDLSKFDKCKQLILSRSINSPYAKIFDRELIEKHHLRFDVQMPVAEDFNFCIAYLFVCEKISVINEAVYFYDVTNTDSLVRSRKKGLIDIYPYVFDTAYNSIINSSFNEIEKKELLCIWDKLHTDSFITCVMEEQKDKNTPINKVLSEIRHMCKKFYSEYKPDYGYLNAVHFLVRLCIKYKLALLLYIMCKIYNKIRG